ncbi:MAG TPA: hypothetical protein VGN91_27380 [Bosea sp. (in: a-proteobacteria)]|jgi:hypothetical protein|nr:hypothetical protein [Bosea sp. (in: a-proteobacteria)]
MSQTLQKREALPGRGRLLWSLPVLVFAVLTTCVVYEVAREMRDDRAEHERCRDRAQDVVEAAACNCILEREDGLFRHALVIFAPRGWQELWHRATRNECMAEAYTRSVTERGIQAVRLLPLPRADGGFSP